MSKGHGNLQRSILTILARYSNTHWTALPHVDQIACEVYGIDDERGQLALTIAQYNAVTRALRRLARRGIVKYAWYPRRARLTRPEDSNTLAMLAGLRALRLRGAGTD